MTIPLFRFGGFHRWGYPKMGGLPGIIVLKWIMLGYPYFKNLPFRVFWAQPNLSMTHLKVPAWWAINQNLDFASHRWHFLPGVQEIRKPRRCSRKDEEMIYKAEMVDHLGMFPQNWAVIVMNHHLWLWSGIHEQNSPSIEHVYFTTIIWDMVIPFEIAFHQSLAGGHWPWSFWRHPRPWNRFCRRPVHLGFRSLFALRIMLNMFTSFTSVIQ